MGVPEGKCGICLEEFKAGTSISIIPCQPGASPGTDHVFCHPCIQQWVRMLTKVVPFVPWGVLKLPKPAFYSI